MLYYYTARTIGGRFVKGSLEAQAPASALSTLRSRALFVTSLEHPGSFRGSVASLLNLMPVGHAKMVAFFRSFATLVHAGVSIKKSLEVTIEQCSDPRLREALSSVSAGIEAGLSLSDALARHPNEFAKLQIACVRAGELSGTLDEVLERLAAVLERERVARKRIGAALAYPCIVLAAAIGLIFFLLTTIVPVFSAMYSQMRVPLPPATAALITIGEWLHGSGALAAALCLAIAAASAAVVRTSTGVRAAMESLLFHVPYLGAVRRKSCASRFARLLGTLLRSGVGIIPALDVTAESIDGSPYSGDLRNIRLALQNGSAFSTPLTQSRLFEAMFVQMVAVGEETGSLDAMLLKIADYYDVDVEVALSTLGAVLEPAMILFLGGAVAFIVSAIFIPLYTLIGNIR